MSRTTERMFGLSMGVGFLWIVVLAVLAGSATADVPPPKSYIQGKRPPGEITGLEGSVRYRSDKYGTIVVYSSALNRPGAIDGWMRSVERIALQLAAQNPEWAFSFEKLYPAIAKTVELYTGRRGDISVKRKGKELLSEQELAVGDLLRIASQVCRALDAFGPGYALMENSFTSEARPYLTEKNRELFLNSSDNEDYGWTVYTPGRFKEDQLFYEMYQYPREVNFSPDFLKGTRGVPPGMSIPTRESVLEDLELQQKLDRENAERSERAKKNLEGVDFLSKWSSRMPFFQLMKFIVDSIVNKTKGSSLVPYLPPSGKSVNANLGGKKVGLARKVSESKAKDSTLVNGYVKGSPLAVNPLLADSLDKKGGPGPGFEEFVASKPDDGGMPVSVAPAAAVSAVPVASESGDSGSSSEIEDGAFIVNGRWVDPSEGKASEDKSHGNGGGAKDKADTGYGGTGTDRAADQGKQDQEGTETDQASDDAGPSDQKDDAKCAVNCGDKGKPDPTGDDGTDCNRGCLGFRGSGRDDILDRDNVGLVATVASFVSLISSQRDIGVFDFVADNLSGKSRKDNRLADVDLVRVLADLLDGGDRGRGIRGLEKNSVGLMLGLVDFVAVVGRNGRHGSLVANEVDSDGNGVGPKDPTPGPRSKEGKGTTTSIKHPEAGRTTAGIGSDGHSTVQSNYTTSMTATPMERSTTTKQTSVAATGTTQSLAVKVPSAGNKQELQGPATKLSGTINGVQQAQNPAAGVQYGE